MTKPLTYREFINSGKTDSDWDAYAAEQNKISRARGIQTIIDSFYSTGVSGISISHLLATKNVNAPGKLLKLLEHDDTVVSSTHVYGKVKRAEAKELHKWVSDQMNKHFPSSLIASLLDTPLIKSVQVLQHPVLAVTGINLSMIGIPDSLQDRMPNEMYYPAGFNPLARGYWLEMFADPVFKKSQVQTDVGIAWLHTVKSFLNRCQSDGIDAFKSKRDETVNNAVRTMITNRRQMLKRYLDVSGLFSSVKVIPDSSKHKYEVLYTRNLVLTCSLQFEVASKESLVAFLRSPEMRMLPNGKGFSYNLLKNLKVSVTKITSRKACLEYELEIRPPFYIPDTKKTRQDRHEWFDAQFFNPMVRGHRFNNLLQRIMF